MATEFFDVDGIPVSLGNVAGVPSSSAAWDSVPPRVFDPSSARRNGSPIDLAGFKSLLNAEALAFANSQAGLTAPAMKPSPAALRVDAAIEKFKADNKGKTWDDLADEIDRKQGMGKPLQVEAEKRVAAAILKFNKDNEGKTWEDLAQEQEKHLGKPSV